MHSPNTQRWVERVAGDGVGKATHCWFGISSSAQANRKWMLIKFRNYLNVETLFTDTGYSQRCPATVGLLRNLVRELVMLRSFLELLLRHIHIWKFCSFPGINLNIKSKNLYIFKFLKIRQYQAINSLYEVKVDLNFFKEILKKECWKNFVILYKRY